MSTRRFASGIPQIEIPRWHRAECGLWVPATSDPRPAMALEVGRTPVGDAVLAPLRTLPSAYEQIGVFIDEAALGIRPLTPEQVEALVEDVGFEPAVWGLAAIARALENVDATPSAQLALAQKLYADDGIVARIGDALRAGHGDVVLCEQQLTALCRLAVMSARPLEMARVSEANGGALERALLASGSLILTEGERVTGDAPDELELTSTLFQIGAFCAREPLADGLGRAAYMLGTIARSAAALGRHDYVDLGALGPDVETQLALGLAALGHSDALTGSVDDLRPGLLAPDWSSVVAEALQISAKDIEELLCADRDWYASTFAAREADLELSAHVARAGWNRMPFETRPLLRLDSGQLMLWSPDALTAWMTDGIYHRYHERARAIGQDGNFRTFYGWLVEEYVRDALAGAHPGQRPPGGSRLLGEITYESPRGERRSPDLSQVACCGVAARRGRRQRLRLPGAGPPPPADPGRESRQAR